MPVETIHAGIALMFSAIWLTVAQLVVSERRRVPFSGSSAFSSETRDSG